MRSMVFLLFNSRESLWELETSIAFSVDQWWYQQQKEKPIRQFPLTPYLPNYIALYVKETLENALRKDLIHEVSLRAVLALIRKEMAQVNQQLPQFCLSIDSVLQEGSYFTKDPYQETVDWSWLEEDAYLILPYLEGRLWLEEQIQKRLETVGIHLQGIRTSSLTLSDYLPFLLQYLYVRREIELNAGVRLIRNGNSLIAECERCGSIHKPILTQYCSLCTHDDVICDRCYTVGASKGCSLVVSRPRNLRLEDDRIVNVPLHWSGEL